MSIAPKTRLVVVRNGTGPLHIALPLADGRFETCHSRTARWGSTGRPVYLPAGCTVFPAGRPARAVWGRWRRCPKCAAWNAGVLAIRSGK